MLPLKAHRAFDVEHFKGVDARLDKIEKSNNKVPQWFALTLSGACALAMLFVGLWFGRSNELEKQTQAIYEIRGAVNELSQIIASNLHASTGPQNTGSARP